MEELKCETSVSHTMILPDQGILSPKVAGEAGSESPNSPEEAATPSTEVQQTLLPLDKLRITSATDEDAMEVEPAALEKITKAKKSGGSKRNSRRRARSFSPRKRLRTYKVPSTVLNRVKTFLIDQETAVERERQLLRLADPSKISFESDSDSDREQVDGRMDTGTSEQLDVPDIDAMDKDENNPEGEINLPQDPLETVTSEEQDNHSQSLSTEPAPTDGVNNNAAQVEMKLLHDPVYVNVSEEQDKHSQFSKTVVTVMDKLDENPAVLETCLPQEPADDNVFNEQDNHSQFSKTVLTDMDKLDESPAVLEINLPQESVDTNISMVKDNNHSFKIGTDDGPPPLAKRDVAPINKTITSACSIV